MMEQILFDQLPEGLKIHVFEKHVKFIGYTENPQGRSYFIYESTELTSYLHVKNEIEEKFLTIMKVPFTWLRLAADQIPGVADYLEEIVQYAEMDKEESI